MATTAKKVWRGAAVLRRFLVPIADLEPFPGNPRVGDVAALRESLRRWGQKRAILVDGNRIVAGHHLVLAAEAEGYTHVAAIPAEFDDENDARAYSLADNRTHDLGQGYDTELLYAQLKSLQVVEGGLEATGYTDDYVSDLDAEVEALRREIMAPEEFPEINPESLAIEHRCPSCGYEWSGNPAPGAAAPDDADEAS